MNIDFAYFLFVWISVMEWCLHTQASFNTMRYKGRDYASGIGKKLPIIRPGATTVVAP
jgi:hypothetical protein